MYPPRAPDDEPRPTDRPRTWAGLAVVTALAAAVPFALWAAAKPTAGALAVCGVLALVAAGRAATDHDDAAADGSDAAADGSDAAPRGSGRAPDSRDTDAGTTRHEATGRDASEVRTAAAPARPR
jgi:hypothetical protein